jgi:transcriptional regulator with XRE-family HTH domain
MQNSAGKHVLAKVRQEAGLTQGQLADRLGCHKMTVQRVEQGLLELSVSLAERIQEVLGVSAAWLLTNDFEATEITPEGRPWYKRDFEMHQVRATTWGKAVLPPPKETPNQLATLTEQYKRWRLQRLATHMDSSLSQAQKAGRLNEFGLLLNRLEEAVYGIVTDFGFDVEVLEAGKAKEAALRKAYEATLAATQQPQDSLPPAPPRKRRHKRS